MRNSASNSILYKVELSVHDRTSPPVLCSPILQRHRMWARSDFLAAFTKQAPIPAEKGDYGFSTRYGGVMGNG